MAKEIGKKHLCLFFYCEANMSYYNTIASRDEIQNVFLLWKVCTKHARELDEANQIAEKREIERTVA